MGTWESDQNRKGGEGSCLAVQCQCTSSSWRALVLPEPIGETFWGWRLCAGGRFPEPHEGSVQDRYGASGKQVNGLNLGNEVLCSLPCGHVDHDLVLEGLHNDWPSILIQV